MPAFGETIIHIFTTIISGILNTTVTVIKDIATLIKILKANQETASPISLLIAAAILVVLVFSLYKLIKGESKVFLISLGVLIILVILAMFL